MSKQQLVNELHKPARRIFPRRQIITKGLDDLWQNDLVDMQPYAKLNKNNKYLLTIIDTLSRYAWAVPLKNKTGIEVSKAFQKVFKEGRVPNLLLVDRGKEFYNSSVKELMKKYNINMYSTYSSQKAASVERFNRTLKNNMWKQFSLQGNYNYLKILPKLITKYNDTVHSSINTKPRKVNEKKAKELLKTQNIKVAGPAKFKVGDYVRVSKFKHVFAKGYLPNFSNEIFVVDKVQSTNPVTYILKDYCGIVHAHVRVSCVCECMNER